MEISNKVKNMKTTNIAVFGDLHGRILLAFWLAKKWQEEHNAEIDYIFSVGDVGIYRTINDMDKATKRFAAKYPEELGFSKFFYARDSNNAFRFQRNDIVDHVLEGLGCNFYFVEGNHEDHQFIGQIRYNYSCDLERSVVLDYDWQGVASGLYADDEFTGYRRIYALPQGPPVDLTSYDLDRAPIIVQAINGLDNYTHPDSWKFKKRQNIDILLSHETYKYRLKGFDLTGKRDNYGSERLRELIESSGPKWHFLDTITIIIQKWILKLPGEILSKVLDLISSFLKQNHPL